MNEMEVHEVTERVEAMSLDDPTQFGEEYEDIFLQNDQTEVHSNDTTAHTTEMELFGSMFPNGWPQPQEDPTIASCDTKSDTSEVTIRPHSVEPMQWVDWNDPSSPANEQDDSASTASTSSYTMLPYIPTDEASFGSADSATIASGTIGGTESRVGEPAGSHSRTGSYIPLDKSHWLRVESSFSNDKSLIKCDDYGKGSPITLPDMKLAAERLTIMYKCTRNMNQSFKANESKGKTSRDQGLRREMEAWQQAYKELKTSEKDYKGLKVWLQTLRTEEASEEDVVAMLIPMVEKLHATHEQAVADEDCPFEKVWDHLRFRCICEATSSAEETG